MSECNNCGAHIHTNWNFCVQCGARITKQKDVFEDIFERMNKELGDVNKLFEKQIETMDITPWFQTPKGKGFSIKITTSTGSKPKVEMRTFGDVDENQLKKVVSNQLGVQDIQAPKELQKKPRITPKTTEEPKTEVTRVDGKVQVKIDIPDAKEGDIEIRELESSIEIKAVVGDKAYFKILKKPEKTTVTERRFNKGVLYITLS